jgi:hypothetical protein
VISDSAAVLIIETAGRIPPCLDHVPPCSGGDFLGERCCSNTSSFLTQPGLLVFKQELDTDISSPTSRISISVCCEGNLHRNINASCMFNSIRRYSCFLQSMTFCLYYCVSEDATANAVYSVKVRSFTFFNRDNYCTTFECCQLYYDYLT